jgi:hypothetical protein
MYMTRSALPVLRHLDHRLVRILDQKFQGILFWSSCCYVIVYGPVLPSSLQALKSCCDLHGLGSQYWGHVQHGETMHPE